MRDNLPHGDLVYEYSRPLSNYDSFEYATSADYRRRCKRYHSCELLFTLMPLLIVPERETPNLNALSSGTEIRFSRKRSVWTSPRVYMLTRIELLDQERLVRCHPRGVVPLVGTWPTRFHLPRFRTRARRKAVTSLRLGQRFGKFGVHGYQIFFGHRTRVADGEVVAVNFVKRSPEIDDGPPTLLESFCFLRRKLCELAIADELSAEVGLIDVYCVSVSAFLVVQDNESLCLPLRLGAGAVTGASSAKSFSASYTFSHGCRRAMCTTGSTLLAPVLCDASATLK